MDWNKEKSSGKTFSGGLIFLKFPINSFMKLLNKICSANLFISMLRSVL